MTGEFLRPTERARRTGVSTDTLRYYEKKRSPHARGEIIERVPGVLPHAETRVRLVRRALALNFALGELAVRDNGRKEIAASDRQPLER